MISYNTQHYRLYNKIIAKFFDIELDDISYDDLVD